MFSTLTPSSEKIACPKLALLLFSLTDSTAKAGDDSCCSIGDKTWLACSCAPAATGTAVATIAKTSAIDHSGARRGFIAESPFSARRHPQRYHCKSMRPLTASELLIQIASLREPHSFAVALAVICSSIKIDDRPEPLRDRFFREPCLLYTSDAAD